MQSNRARSLARRGGFTLVEILVVISIIVVLISILIPVVGRVQTSARNAAAQAFMTQLARAIETYQTDFKAYPGPVTNGEVWNPTAAAPPLNPDFVSMVTPTDLVSTDYQTASSVNFKNRITMPENLVLGLLGGLTWVTTPTPGLFYDPRLVGSGPRALNKTGPTKQYKPYIETVNLSWRLTEDKGGVPQPEESPAGKKTGHFRDDADPVGPEDTIIPEFLDPFPDPLPILYLRAKRGAQSKPGTLSEINNTIVTYDPLDHNNRVGQYDLHQIIAYTQSKIGVGRKAITAEGWINPVVHGLMATNADKVQPFASMTNPPAQPIMKYMYPYNAYPYFRNQSLSSPKDTDPEFLNLGSPRNDVPHQKDGFILIGAGPDRIYGTKDDVTNFGAVAQ